MLGKRNPAIKITIPERLARQMDLGDYSRRGEKDPGGPQELIAQVLDVNFRGDFSELGVSAHNRTVQVFHEQSRRGVTVELGNNALTEEQVTSLLLRGEYDPMEFLVLKDQHPPTEVPVFHAVLNNEDHVINVTCDQDLLFLGLKDPEDISDIHYNRHPHGLLYEEIPLRELPALIDDPSWGVMVDWLHKDIDRSLNGREPAPENRPGPALQNEPPLFDETPLDLTPEQIERRLSLIEHTRPYNGPDLKNALELIEISLSTRHNRPVVKERLSEATWNGVLLEDRADESMETLEYELDALKALQEAARAKVEEANNGGTGFKADEHAIMMARDCKIGELESVIDGHPEKVPSVDLS